MEFSLVDNADHPLEHEAARLTRAYLEKMSWPFDRMPVRIQFGVRTVSSQSMLNASLVDGRLHGKASLFFNYLYLLQQEGPFLENVVPHEVAHILASAEAQRKGVEIKEHGPEWQRWLMSLSINATPKSTGPGAIFDDRAIRLFKGGIPVHCQCEGDARFNVLPSTAEAKLGALSCDLCESLFVRTGRDEAPASILNQYEYIANEQSCRHAG